MTLPEELLERYEVIRPLGEGGMGIVYLARHLQLAVPVAIKLLTKEAGLDADLSHRFIEEGRLAARVRHANVVLVMESGVASTGTPFVVYEFLDGEDLSARLAQRGRLPETEAVRIVCAVLEGLGAIHAAQIVHRDIKPANIVITSSGEVKILDFGIARNLLDARVRTRTGIVLGSPLYVSPEAIGGGAVGPEADLYSVGALLFELIAGRPPFEGTALGTILSQHLNVEPPPLRDLVPGVTDSVAAAVKRALAKRPGERHRDADAFRAALARDARAPAAPPGTGPQATSKRSTGRNSTQSATRAVSRPLAMRSDSDVVAPATRRPGWRAVAAVLFIAGAAFVWVQSRSAMPAPREQPVEHGKPAEPHPDAGRVARAQLGHLLLLAETERHADRPIDLTRRLQYLRGALTALESANGQGDTIAAATWTVAALLADEARFACSIVDLAPRARPQLDQAMACRERLSARVLALLEQLKSHAGDQARAQPHVLEDVASLRALVRTSRGAAPLGSLLWVAAVAADERPSLAARSGSMAGALTQLREATVAVTSTKGGQEAARAVGQRYRELGSASLDGSRRAVASTPDGSAGSRPRVTTWLLSDRERASLREADVRLDASIDPLVPLLGMCAADAAQRWLYRGIARARLSRRPDEAAAPDGRPPNPRTLGLLWLDLSWLASASAEIDQQRLRRLRTEASASEFQSMMPDASVITGYFSCRADVLPPTQLLLDDRIRELFRRYSQLGKEWGGR